MFAMEAGYIWSLILIGVIIICIVCTVLAVAVENDIDLAVIPIVVGLIIFIITVGIAWATHEGIWNANQLSDLEKHTGLDIVKIRYNDEVTVDCFDKNAHVVLTFSSIIRDGQRELLYFVDQNNYVFITKDNINLYYPFDCKVK